MTTPSKNFGLKAFGFIAVGVSVFVTIAWLTAKNTTPYANPNAASRAAAGNPITLAILPFVATAGDSTSTAFAATLVDSVTVALARVSGFRVSPRQASAHMVDDAGLNVLQAGTMLGVATLLRGAVRIEGGKVLVEARLTDTKLDKQLWSQSYVRDSANALTIRDDVVRDAATQLQTAPPPPVQ